MTSGGRKNTATKTQPSSSKPSLKQTTLFRSFSSSKNATKEIPAETKVSPQDAAVMTPADNAPVSSTNESTLQPPPEPPVPPKPVDVQTIVDDSPIDLTEAIDVDAGEDIPKPVPSPDRRSPSITIIEDDFITIVPPPSVRPAETSKKKGVNLKGRTREEPIVIVSPIKVSSASQDVNKPIHPFFMSKPKAASLSVRPALARTSKSTSHALSPPFPDGDSQHVRGPQSHPAARSTTFPKRASKNCKEDFDGSNDYSFLKARETLQAKSTEFMVQRTPDASVKSLTNGIPEEHISSHPAIARLVNDNSENWPESRRPWSDKWRPSCAQEVLGNEKSAIYLRNWLRALELQFEDNTDPISTDLNQGKSSKGKSKQSNKGIKRSRIVRTVEKRRKRSRLGSDDEDDSWIAYTDESEEEEVNYEELDELEEIHAEVPASSSSSAPHDFPLLSNDSQEEDLGQLHNTILLSGPSGSGKTASVYACAEELGWDVFEVYPGVGKRNGSNVDNLIGEVGKNHLVLQNRQNTDVLKSFLSKKGSTQSNGEDIPSADISQPAYSPRKKPTASNDISGLEDGSEQASNTIKPIRQSLILLEEVDILFKDDLNFWTTVTRIIKDCKRPVICTCNDISLVPISELPLQSIIYFEPCPVEVATSYLEALCLAEGYAVERKAVSRLYMYPDCDSGLNDPRPDLRRTINSLQVICSTNCSPQHRSEPIGSSSTLQQNSRSTGRKLVDKIQFMSYLDGNLVQNCVDYDVTTELSSYLPSENDEIGHSILYDIHATDRLEFGRYDRQEDIICTAVETASRLFDMDQEQDAREERKCEEARREAVRDQRDVMREICPAAVWSRGNGSLWLEYMPYVRQMVEAEDGEEAREMEKRRSVRSGRMTRNSAGRGGYVRTISLTESGRDRLDRCGI
ncbi:P-loop containing nucleoside triphosphate hydrolase protein [Agrocybe pediades]|nr:P-loop containing nucleoside triphosphate hydrolase protein [Agrocybe pediades]